MYSLPYFKEKDINVVKDFVRQNPFAFISGCTGDHKPVATQVPVFIDEREGKMFLSGHIMRNTDHHKAFVQNPNVLAVFSGPHTYVSASWYTDKRQGSTWNYVSVHARGTMKLLDEAALRDILKRTTNHFEGDPHSGANFEDLPDEYVNSMVKAIVGFEIEVVEFDNVFKLSQNRDEESFHTIMDKLETQNDGGKWIAGEMKKRTSLLFKKK